MKTVSIREFYHTPALVRGLQPGEKLTVTKDGTPDFVVVKSGVRKRESIEQLKREAQAVRGKKFNGVEIFNALR